MASQPVDFVSGLGALPNPQQAMDENIARRLGQERAGLQNQALAQGLALQQQEAVQKQAEQERYQSDVAAALANPTAKSYSDLFAKHPQFKDAISKSWDTRDASARQGDLSQLGQVHAALKGGRKDLAVKLLQSRIAADKEAGTADEEDQRFLDALTNDDPSDDAAVLGMTGAALAAIVGPDKYASAMEQISGDQKNFTLSAGAMRFDPSGKLIAQAPFAPIQADPSKDIVQLSNPASSGGGTQPLSIRLNNPGAIRFDPSNQWQGQVRNADGFVEFDTVENGRRAHTKLIANQIKAGYDTPLKWAQHYAPASDGNDPVAYAGRVAAALGIGVNDKFPANAPPRVQALSAAVESGGTPAPSAGGVRVLRKGTPAPDDNPVDTQTVQFYAEKVAAGGDLPALGSGKSATAWRQAILKRSAQIQAGRGLSGGESNLAQADVKANRSALLQAQKQYTSTVGFEDTFQRNVKEVLRLAPSGVAGGVPAFNRWVQAGRKNLKGDPAVSAFNVAVNTAANEYAKLASGASGGAVTSDSARHEAMEILNNAQTLPQLQASIRQMQIDGHNRVVALDTQIKRLRGNISGAGGRARPAPPKPGMVQKGYRYKGGNPASPSSWVKI